MKKPVILSVSVLLLCTSCRAPEPARERFGDEIWETFTRGQRADAYRLKPSPTGAIVGPTTFASSARRDAPTLHRFWSFMQSAPTFEPGVDSDQPPVPQFLIRYGRGAKSIDVAIDVEGGWLSMYVTGQPELAEWISIGPVKDGIASELRAMFGGYEKRFTPKEGT